MTGAGAPRVWINVTTSAHWQRPAVGIVRVERALAEQLQALLGYDRCRLCVWDNGRFVHWAAGTVQSAPDVDDALNVLLPRNPSFDLARLHLARSLRSVVTHTVESIRELTVRFAVGRDDEETPEPLPGDILITAGLDWDHPYSKQFHDLARRQGLRIVGCCYDLIPVIFPQYCVGDVSRYFTEYFMELSWGSEAVMCISRQSERDYIELCRELGAPRRRTIVIPLGDNLPAGGGDIGDEVRSLANSPFILYVSTIERRKNHEVLYRAYHHLARRGYGAALPRLVFVGMKGWGIAELMNDIELDPLTKDMIVQLNHVTDSELALLYEKSLFCVFPSLYEGWGLPVGEALSMGKAVIASGEGSLPEVGGDLVRYVSPWNAYGWADAILEYVTKPEAVRAAEARVKAGYVPRKWQDTARRVVELLDDMTAGAANPARERTFYPGYDLSTQCGVHWGPAIRGTGVGGLLLFGPHVSLRRGTYRLQLLGSVQHGGPGTLRVEVTSADSAQTHFSRTFDRNGPFEGAIVDCEFELPQNAHRVEFRCLVEPGYEALIETVQLTTL